MFHTGIIDFLRAEGLRVVETNGWRTRGSSTFSPRGSVNHHTAGSASGNAPSLGVVLNGTSATPGPLCNFLQARDDTIYLIAAGRANHAGTGGWRGMAGNSTVWGLEVEHTGYSSEPFPSSRYLASSKVHAACAKYSQFTADMVCQHREWAPDRKVDFCRAYIPDGEAFRRSVAVEIAPPAPTPVPEIDDMILMPSFGSYQSNGRVPFYELRPIDADTFMVVSFNGAPLLRVDGTTPSGFWYLVQNGTTGAALGIGEFKGKAVVGCQNGGTYQVSP